MKRSSQLFAIVALLLISSSGFAKKARTVYLTEKKTEGIFIGTEGTVLNFPSKPNKVVLGNKGGFAVQYIEDDLAVSALVPGAQSNLFVYLDGRRFGFNLKAVTGGGDEIVLVRDPDEKKMKVKIKYE